MEILLIETAPGVITQTYFHRGGDKLIVWHHGIPAPRPMSPQMLEVFSNHGYSVAAPVRQGYQKSTVVGPRPVADDTQVTKAVVEYLGFKEFKTIGYSGGGPRAMADLALLDNCLAGIAFATLAPIDAPGFDPFANAPEEDTAMMAELREMKPELRAMFEGWQEGFLAQDPMASFADADEDTKAWLESADAKFRFAQKDLAFESGIDGWMLDERSIVVPYGFDVTSITKPLMLITGDKDVNVDMSCSVWLNENIPSSELRVYQGMGHSRVFALDTIEDALANF
jgi:pimeloyl-ACP methyl ester carboxylesterase